MSIVSQGGTDGLYIKLVQNQRSIGVQMQMINCESAIVTFLSSAHGLKNQHTFLFLRHRKIEEEAFCVSV